MNTAESWLAELIRRRSSIVVLTETCDTNRVPVQNSGIVLLQRRNINDPGPSFVGFEVTGALKIAEECQTDSNSVTLATLLRALAEKRPEARLAIEEIVMPMVEDRGINIMYI